MRVGKVRLAAIATGCVLSWVGMPTQEAASDQQATFRTRTDVVSVNVSVKQGRQPVGNLTAGDFALTDNGVEQTVDALSLARVPIDLTLVMAGYESPSRDSLDAYFRDLTSASNVRRSLLPQDRLRLVWVQTEIRGGLVGNEESLWANEAMDIEHYMSVSVVDGLFYAMAWPVEPDRRHLVVAFTDGFDRYSVLEMETLPRLAAHSDAVLHVVLRPNSHSQEMLRIEWETDHEIVSEAARRTGGTVRSARDASQDLAAIIDDYRTSYVLQYAPRGGPAPGWHGLRVRVKRPGRFDVRARRGYEVRRD